MRNSSLRTLMPRTNVSPHIPCDAVLLQSEEARSVPSTA